MAIQDSINSMLGTAAIMARLSPLHDRQERIIKDKELASSAIAAQAGINDIYNNVTNSDERIKTYSDEQLNDMYNRTVAHNHLINEYKTALEDPMRKKNLEKYKDKIDTGLTHAAKMGVTEMNIGGELERRREMANKRAADFVEQRNYQRAEKFNKASLKKSTHPVDPIMKEGLNGINK